jgi:polyhydroxyalkanoate synthesis regulator phasin
MRDLIHKILYTGIGMAALTEKKAQELVSEMVKQGEVSAEEGKNLVRELMDRAKAQAEETRKLIVEEMDKVRWPSRKEFEELKKRLAELEARLAAPSPPQQQG